MKVKLVLVVMVLILTSCKKEVVASQYPDMNATMLSMTDGYGNQVNVELENYLVRDTLGWYNVDQKEFEELIYWINRVAKHHVEVPLSYQPKKLQFVRLDHDSTIVGRLTIRCKNVYGTDIEVQKDFQFDKYLYAMNFKLR